MTRAITVRLDDTDYATLASQADQLRVRPGTLARMLVRAGLSGDSTAREDARTAVKRLVARSHKLPGDDAVSLVKQARTALEMDR